jgi:hypothetical protein
MPQRTLTTEEIERLKDTPFGKMKKILEDRRVPDAWVKASQRLHRDVHFRLVVERCEFDNGDPYLRISEATNGVGFIFSLDGEMIHIVNYK